MNHADGRNDTPGDGDTPARRRREDPKRKSRHVAEWVSAIGTLIAAGIAALAYIIPSGNSPLADIPGVPTNAPAPSATTPVSPPDTEQPGTTDDAEKLKQRIAMGNALINNCTPATGAEKVAESNTTLKCDFTKTFDPSFIPNYPNPDYSSVVAVRVADFGSSTAYEDFINNESKNAGSASTQSGHCRPGPDSGCCQPGPMFTYSGQWGSAAVTPGRLICYQTPKYSRIVWTFDTDAFFDVTGEDFAVIVDGHDERFLTDWFNKTPV